MKPGQGQDTPSCRELLGVVNVKSPHQGRRQVLLPVPHCGCVRAWERTNWHACAGVCTGCSTQKLCQGEGDNPWAKAHTGQTLVKSINCSGQELGRPSHGHMSSVGHSVALYPSFSNTTGDTMGV